MTKVNYLKNRVFIGGSNLILIIESNNILWFNFLLKLDFQLIEIVNRINWNRVACPKCFRKDSLDSEDSQDPSVSKYLYLKVEILHSVFSRIILNKTNSSHSRMNQVRNGRFGIWKIRNHESNEGFFPEYRCHWNNDNCDKAIAMPE